MNIQTLPFRFTVVVSLLLLGVALVGCGSRSPEDTTRVFVEGLQKADEPGVRSVLTKTANQKMDKPLELKRNDTIQYSVGQGTITEQTAQVPVIVKEDGKEETLYVKLRQEEGQWRVYAMRLPMTPGGPDVTLDFEHPEAFYGEMFKNLGEGIGAMLKGIGEGLGAMLKGLGDGLQKIQ